MTDMSPFAGRGNDPHFDCGQPFSCQYMAVDLRDGRYGVFVVHRDSREWWRLIAIFSSLSRAEAYAEVENECADYCAPDNTVERDRRIQHRPHLAEEWSPASEELPAEPETAVTPANFRRPPKPESNPEPTIEPAQTPAEAAPIYVYTPEPTQAPTPDPESTPAIAPISASEPGSAPVMAVPERTLKICERCQKTIPAPRGYRAQTKYCTPCAEAIQLERTVEANRAARERAEAARAKWLPPAARETPQPAPHPLQAQPETIPERREEAPEANADDPEPHVEAEPDPPSIAAPPSGKSWCAWCGDATEEGAEFCSDECEDEHRTDEWQNREAEPLKIGPLPPAKPFNPALSEAFANRRAGGCSWPSGDPETADFSFCGKPTSGGRSYCDQHHSAAYVRKRSREGATAQ